MVLSNPFNICLNDSQVARFKKKMENKQIKPIINQPKQKETESGRILLFKCETDISVKESLTVGISQVGITLSPIVRPKAIYGCFLFPWYIQSIDLIYFLARILGEANKGEKWNDDIFVC